LQDNHDKKIKTISLEKENYRSILINHRRYISRPRYDIRWFSYWSLPRDMHPA